MRPNPKISEQPVSNAGHIQLQVLRNIRPCPHAGQSGTHNLVAWFVRDNNRRWRGCLAALGHWFQPLGPCKYCFTIQRLGSLFYACGWPKGKTAVENEGPHTKRRASLTC